MVGEAEETVPAHESEDETASGRSDTELLVRDDTADGRDEESDRLRLVPGPNRARQVSRRSRILESTGEIAHRPLSARHPLRPDEKGHEHRPGINLRRPAEIDRGGEGSALHLVEEIHVEAQPIPDETEEGVGEGDRDANREGAVHERVGDPELPEAEGGGDAETSHDHRLRHRRGDKGGGRGQRRGRGGAGEEEGEMHSLRGVLSGASDRPQDPGSGDLDERRGSVVSIEEGGGGEEGGADRVERDVSRKVEQKSREGYRVREQGKQSDRVRMEGGRLPTEGTAFEKVARNVFLLQ